MMHAHRFWYVFRFRSCAVGVKGLIPPPPRPKFGSFLAPAAQGVSGVRSRESSVGASSPSHDLHGRRPRAHRGAGGGAEPAGEGRREATTPREAKTRTGTRTRRARRGRRTEGRPTEGRPTEGRPTEGRLTEGRRGGARRKGARRTDAGGGGFARSRARPRARRDNCRAHEDDAMCAEGARTRVSPIGGRIRTKHHHTPRETSLLSTITRREGKRGGISQKVDAKLMCEFFGRSPVSEKERPKKSHDRPESRTHPPLRQPFSRTLTRVPFKTSARSPASPRRQPLPSHISPSRQPR